MQLSRSRVLKRIEREQSMIRLVIVIGYADAHAPDAIGGGATAVGTEDLFTLARCHAIACSIGLIPGWFTRADDRFCVRCHGERCFTAIMACRVKGRRDGNRIWDLGLG